MSPIAASFLRNSTWFRIGPHAPHHNSEEGVQCTARCVAAGAVSTASGGPTAADDAGACDRDRAAGERTGGIERGHEDEDDRQPHGESLDHAVRVDAPSPGE